MLTTKSQTATGRQGLFLFCEMEDPNGTVGGKEMMKTRDRTGKASLWSDLDWTWTHYSRL